MLLTDIPAKFQTPFGSGASGGNIRAVPYTTTDPNAASELIGFPPPTLTPISGGGVPPDGRDFNGIINQMTAWCRWFSAGGPIYWDSAFSALVGGYPAGSVVRALIPGSSWISTVDGNTTNPDAGGAGWAPYGAASGDAMLTMQSSAPYGWLMMNDGTIGNGASNATTYANALALSLFTVVYNSVSNTWAPLLTSAGAPVARGADAATDFAANRQLTLTKQLGRALCIAGAGATLTNRVLGQTLGEEAHSLTGDENGEHDHFVGTFGGGADIGGGAAQAVPNNGTNLATGPSGLGTAHNNMQPSAFWNIKIKL